MFTENNVADAGSVIDLRRPSLRGLSYILRHKELWPEGFEFNYLIAEMCVIGLARKVWNIPYQRRIVHPDFITDYSELGMSKEQYRSIYQDIRSKSGFRADVTPELAADYIDALVSL